MDLEQEVVPFFEWLFGHEGSSAAIFDFGAVCVALIILGVFLGYLVAAVRRGPIEAFYSLAKILLDAVPDLLFLSSRRIFAIARLAIQESIRMRVFVVLGVFVIIMLFGGWFLDVKSDHPARIYLEFVLTSASYLSLALALFLSAFSIPNDIKNRTIYTVVTKPIRSCEIVLGRILGFTAVGTVFLAVMGLLSYVFVVRGMAHHHQIDPNDMVMISDSATVPAGADSQPSDIQLTGRWTGQTTLNAHHRHKKVTVDAHGRGRTDVEMEHWHTVRAIFDARGEWQFTLALNKNESRQFRLKIDGAKLRPTATLNPSDGGAAVSLGRVELDYHQFNIAIPGSAVGHDGQGRLEGLLLLPTGDQREVLSMKGDVLWPDESSTPFTAEQTDSSADELFSFEVGPSRGALQSRVPHYGILEFIDPDGRKGDGISIGKEWTYRRYIEGGRSSLAAAVWRFQDINPNRLGDQLPLELNLRVWRSQKGNIEKPVEGTIQLRNPKNENIQTNEIEFVSQEYSTQRLMIGRKQLGLGADGRSRSIDVFDDLVEDGQLVVRLRVQDVGQFFGVAQADVYLREADTPFWWNFCKGYISLWLQMIIVICFGVMFSTFLSGAVAMMATVTGVAVGLFSDFIRGVALSITQAESPDAIEGGGPLESMIRVMTQKNISQDLEIGDGGTQFVHYVDVFLMFMMTNITKAMPDFSDFMTSDYISHGFDINTDVLATHGAITLAFFLVLSSIGYFFLKSREIAA